MNQILTESNKTIHTIIYLPVYFYKTSYHVCLIHVHPHVPIKNSLFYNLPKF